MQRILEAAPPDLIDVTKPRFGSFRGGLPVLDVGASGRSRLWDWTHKKRWIYAGVADADVYAAAAIVSLGYVANAIVFALDRRTGRMLFDRSIIAPHTAVEFTDGGSGRRSARFRFGGARIEVGDAGVMLDIGGERHPFHVGVRATKSDAGAAPPIGAVVPIEGGHASATEKRVLDAEGEIVAEGKRFVLSRPLLALDHTCGFLARHTSWRWALGLGRGDHGERIAFNVVEGFVGDAECGAWVGSELFPLGEGRFTYGDPMEPWRITTTCGALDVTFHPQALHSEEKNLLVVRSHFVQPAGVFEGRLRVGGRTITLPRMAGVTEHQDVLW